MNSGKHTTSLLKMMVDGREDPQTVFDASACGTKRLMKVMDKLRHPKNETMLFPTRNNKKKQPTTITRALQFIIISP
jgi:uncharacterized protein YpbB